MDLQWMRVLVELADRDTLRAVADVTGYSPSAVSQHLAALQKALDTVLVEPVGRKLAFTPAGKAFLPHARAILARYDTARGELSPEGQLLGDVRLAGYATGLAHHVIPAISAMRGRHPHLTVTMEEREPPEAQALLDRDEVDIALVYDLSLAPRSIPATAYHEVPMELVVQAADGRAPEEIITDPTTTWITNSRAHDDDELIQRMTAQFGVVPRIAHRADSLDLGIRLIVAGLGAALMAGDGPRHPDVRYSSLHGAAGTRRSYVLTRPGREQWRANATVISAITAAAASSA
ncbi:LysR family transcriptional regulator [Planotetraspora kaengkrachanensis]|nr:LysR family transcriptional regulator [Planotetraspora kaengkrachanensis]